MSNIGKLLKMHMHLNNMGMRGFGKELGVSAATISRLCDGKPIGQDTMLNIINWLFSEKSFDELGNEKIYTQEDLDYQLYQLRKQLSTPKEQQ